MLNKIQDQINLQKEIASEVEMEALIALHDQLGRASSAEWSKEELSELLKSENDILDGFEQDTGFYEEVRNIQDQIITSFGE